MDPKTFQQVVERAKGDPTFFHALVFEPEKVLSEVNLGRRAKGALVAIEPGEVIARLTGVVSACGNTCSSSCDNTCGGSCGYTTNLTEQLREAASVSFFARASGSLGYCGNTCSSSCDNTCGGSCGYTTNLTGRGGWQEVIR